MIRDVDLAWAAGFIDGEGCLYLNGNNYSLYVSQNIKAPLASLKAILGVGRIYEYTRKTPAGKLTQTCSYYIGGKALIPVLQLLIPYLLVKAELSQRIIDDAPNRRFFRLKQNNLL